MNAGHVLPWHDLNQQALVAELDQLHHRLAHTPDRSENGSQPGVWETNGASMKADEPLALDMVCMTFGLTSFERQVLLLCAGMELDARFAVACARANGDPARDYPTFALALAALPDAHWSALLPSAPLRHWRLIETGPEPGLTQARLQIDERILHYLAGINTQDERLAGIVEPVRTSHGLHASHRAVVSRAVAIWRDAHSGREPMVLHLRGPDSAAKRTIALAVVQDLGMSLYAIQASDIPTGAVDIDSFIRLWEREAALSNAVLYLDADEVVADERARAAATERLLARLRTSLIISSQDDSLASPRPTLSMDIPHLRPDEQHALWRDALGRTRALDPSSGLPVDLQPLVAQFTLGTAGIHAAALATSVTALDDLQTALWEACRVQARPKLAGMARRIEPTARWNNLVLPGEQLDLLREIVVHVRQRSRVYEQWGFGHTGVRGLGVSALFSGSSGTGKTLAAEVIAAELDLDLYQIDLSQIVSKYIGETEKNLRTVFDAAEAGGAVLLFDEADALFGKRSDVKDSHDRYANIEVSYLLQRMEAYRGLAILTTNLKTALDPAFLRRIRFVIQFPFPDREQRAEIWRRVFPAETPVRDLDWDQLARLNVAGGNIRNIALHGAFLAADAGDPVTMAHLLRAARGEYIKLEKPLTGAETGGWS